MGLARPWCFVFGTDVRTDTMCETHDHLHGRGLVGQMKCLGFREIKKENFHMKLKF